MELRETPFMVKPASYTASQDIAIARMQPGDLLAFITYDVPTAFDGAASGVTIGDGQDADGYVVGIKAATTETKLSAGAYHTQAAADDASGFSSPGVGKLYQVGTDIIAKFTHDAGGTAGYVKGSIFWYRLGDKKTLAAAAV